MGNILPLTLSFWELRKKISNDTLAELPKRILHLNLMKNLILDLFDEKAILFMTDLKEKMLETSEKK